VPSIGDMHVSSGNVLSLGAEREIRVGLPEVGTQATSARPSAISPVENQRSLREGAGLREQMPFAALGAD
jgi:hypothetical protein